MNHRDADWAKAKQLCRLNPNDIRMAKELGLTPRSLIRNIPSPNQQWKASVKDWIRDLHAKKFGISRTDRTVEDSSHRMTSEEWDEMLESIPLKFPPKDFDILFDDQEGEEEPFIYKTPTAEDIEEQNHYLLRRQKVFRMAAEYFAHEASRIPWVLRIALIGSVAQPLEKQVPRFRDYRRAGIKVWHECKDVDVAVWVNQLSDLNALRRARSQAVNELSRATEGLANVAHHQLDVFILDYARNLYMGNVCIFKSCPNGKDECYAQGCGAAPFLQRYDGFQFHDDAVYPDRIKILFDRSETDNGKNESIWDRPDDDEVPF